MGHSRPVYLNRACMVSNMLDEGGRPQTALFENWLSLYKPRTKWGRGLKLSLHKINGAVKLHCPLERTFGRGPVGSRALAVAVFGDDPLNDLVRRLFVSEEDWRLVVDGHAPKGTTDVWQAKLLAEYALQLYLLICYGSTVYDSKSDFGLSSVERAMFY